MRISLLLRDPGLSFVNVSYRGRIVKSPDPAAHFREGSLAQESAHDAQ